MGQAVGDPAAVRQIRPAAQVYELAERHRAAGRLDDAESLLKQLLDRGPDDATAHHLLGILAHQRGQTGDAIARVKHACELAPDVALFHANLGEMYRLAGRLDLALEHGNRALALQPGYAEALSNVGIAYYELKDFEQAAAAHRRAIEAKPDFARAHSNLGNALHALRRFDEAVTCFRRAVALDPHFADGWSNLGTSLHHSGQYDEAMGALRRAVALDPRNANAHSGLGLLLLMRGDMAEGWDEYEWRLQSTEVRLPYHPQKPWQGESLKGRRIYIHAEQGFGDTIHFARYVPLVAARGAAVTFRVQQGLAGLMRQSFPGVEILGDRGGAAVAADCECALLSLPRIFGTRLETIPARVPYLRADAAEAARWRERLQGRPSFKIGLVWAGNPEHVNDQRRSIGLAALAPLFGVPDVAFVSLQVGPRAAEIEQHEGHGILDAAPGLVGFAETAALVEALDLVVTIDSSVAHLAGALGKPTWLLTPWVSDWRWQIGREDSPWYPTARLFRQAPGQDWHDVAACVAAELAKAARGDAQALTPHRAAGEARARQAAEIIAARESRIVTPPPPPVLSAPQVLAQAERRRQTGKLAEAEMLARRVLDAEAANAEAHHLLGLTAHQSGNLAHAVEHLRRACELAPGNAPFHANLAEMCRLAGRADDAITFGERALQLDPDHADAHSNLGIALYERGDFAAAILHYERAIALKPGFAQAHSNLGNALRAVKRAEDAVPHYRRAIELRQEFGDAWNNLGTTLRDLKRYDEAEAAYRRSLALKPDDPGTLNNLALCLNDLGRLDEAEAALRRSLAIEGSSGQTLLYLATFLVDRHQPDDAERLLARVRALDGDTADVHNLLGRIALERNDPKGALAHHRRALELKPDLADALNNLGNALRELGRLDEARAAYVRALAVDPGLTGGYFNYADSVTFTAADPHLAAMEALCAGTAPLSATDRIRLQYALAKAYADLNDHRRSFECLLRGSRLKRSRVSYDETASLAFFDRIEAAFTREVVEGKAPLGGDPSPVPIFVMGMPRSGTTLVEQILASHPRVFGAGELGTLSDVAGIAYPDVVATLDAAALTDIGRRYVAELRKRAPDVPHITDKMPSNFYYAGLIYLALPNAKIVHTVRDPVDTCVSCFSKLFTTEQGHTYDLAELGRYYRRYQALMAHWRRVLPPGTILDVSYEDVVADLEGQARRILAHCGLGWDERCLAFYRTERPVRTASASQVRQPIYRTAIGRGRIYEEFLGPLLDALAGTRG